MQSLKGKFLGLDLSRFIAKFLPSVMITKFLNIDTISQEVVAEAVCVGRRLPSQLDPAGRHVSNPRT